jgi:hypothetical protein
MKESLYKSLGLHLVACLLLMIEIPNIFSDKDLTISQVPIIIDLNDVKISEMTNLPPKAEMGEEDKEASMEKRKVENYTPPEEEKIEETPAGETSPEVKKEPDKGEPDEAPQEIKEDFLAPPPPPEKPKAPEKKKPAEKTVMVQPKKPRPPKPKPAANTKTPELANPLKSLLASVDDMAKNLKEGDGNGTATIKTGTKVDNMGVEGGVGGSYFSELSVSEADAIAGRLRACWNLDPGAMGIQNMIVEIRAYLNRDGTVKDVRILDTSRYGADPHFRSVADSAKRAVFICAPYKIFAEKYADKYDMWNTLYLRFNPLDGKVN